MGCYGRHNNNINNNKNNSNNCNMYIYNNNYQHISNQRNKSRHYDQSLGRCRPDHPDQSLKRDHNQNNSREYIQYSNPHYYYEVNRKQNHRKHCGHICDCSCKEALDKHETKQIYPQGNNYSSSHRCGNRCKSDLSDQYLDKYKSGPHDQYLNGNYGHRNHCDNNCSYIHSWDHRCKPGHPDQYLDKCKSGQYGQYLNGNYVQKKKEDNTPTRGKRPRPRINLFQNPEEEETGIEIVPVDTDLEVLLINSWKIDAPKVQTIVEDFIRDKKYTTIFCLTETKVKGHDFQPEGIKIFSKQRKKKMEKVGGGLAFGYAEEADVELEEIEIMSNDILAVEGKIHNKKFRMILCYFDSNKLLKGKEFNRNRSLQKQIEKHMEVDPDTSLLVLGDFNGRLTKLEKGKKTDANGRMLESWVEKYNMHHLNTLDTCDGIYTFNSPNGKSAIDHMLTNGTLFEKHIGMVIDEDRTMLNISDHNLVRAWFQIGNNNYNIPKKKPIKTTTWISREQDRIDLCVREFKNKVGKKISFKGCMSKIKT